VNPPDHTAPLLHPARPLSVELAQLRDAFAERPATLREIVVVLAGRAYELLMILCVLPFLLPVSVPGMSTPLGLAVAVIAGQLAFGRLPWLPRWLLDKQLPPGFLATVLRVTQGVVKFLERALRPRLLAFTGARWLNAVHLFFVVVAALLLALPMPIPLTNTLPGWTILLFAAGLMERDGLAVVAGYVAMAATTVLFYAVGEGVRHSLLVVWHWLTG
jgi:hypothetical protein